MSNINAHKEGFNALSKLRPGEELVYKDSSVIKKQIVNKGGFENI
jgi:hypothetical protein